MNKNLPRYRRPTSSRLHRQVAVLVLLSLAAWLLLRAQPAAAQIVRRVSQPPPTADAARLTIEDTPNDVISPDGVDDILSLADESLESLARQDVVVPAMDTEVSTVSRTASTIGRSSAAIFVITNEMIRRSGARSIPEALRMAPGVEVARMDSNKWAVSVRGANARFSGKLLVQIDGRNVYDSTFAGVYWDAPDVLLEDVERIELIRGPGAAVWGANAVNGIINVITRRAEDTVGVYVQAGGGTEESAFTSARIGGRAAGGQVYWRLWGKWFERDSGFRPDQPTYDDWQQGRGGFRADWTPTDYDTVTFQGACYQGISSAGERSIGPGGPPGGQRGRSSRRDDDIQGEYLLGRWTRELSDESDFSLQAYFDRDERTEEGDIYGLQDTWDLDFQHNFRLGWRNQIVWGLGFRDVSDNFVPQPGSSTIITPAQRTTNLFSGFVQDEMTLVEDHLCFTIGTKLEDNDYTGFEIQPTARVLWAPDPTRAAWGAVSRAVRTPSRWEHDFESTGRGFRLFGSRDVVSEVLLAYEVGYRAQPVEWFSWDMALFYNVYDDLVTFSRARRKIVFTNDMTGETYGVELFGRLELTPCWRLSASYSFLRVHLHPGPTSLDDGERTESSSPHNQASLRSSWDLGRNWKLDLAARYVDYLPAQQTPSYITMDLRAAWHPTERLELAVVGQNLLDTAHKEFNMTDFGIQYTEVQRGVYGSVTWRH